MTAEPTDRRRRTPEQRRARADRILDAAAELVARWGYDKTTLDDVSRHAHVAKGTIYLHWKSREALFTALLRRERVLMLEAVRLRTAGQAEPVGGLVRQLALEMLRRPLLKALLLGDGDVLGALLRHKRTSPEAAEAMFTAFAAYLGVLREHGLVRSDLTPADQQNVMATAFYGFFHAPALPGPFHLDIERRAALLAETVQRTLGSGHPVTPESAAQVAEATARYLDRALEIARRKLEESL
ncbi:TetR/AcrR family transcriptional regulator [Planomonospora parontospora]|uniref:TetR/AcrR family transcriptional regulator n=1 Tax=Planomonospora parontospora TaxID=58119 RepID=UPI001670F83D|nr:TetR/AcrR family transcriptional regulator [Planomonospora parontospora]GGL15449.1 TetR family transcriptional regulator [Planomonospora parontospora subsp. antibiotica]GII15963.1 TetR family transcriptional regulator [Planomonospora parontospora subsp. antibiotica]